MELCGARLRGSARALAPCCGPRGGGLPTSISATAAVAGLTLEYGSTLRRIRRRDVSWERLDIDVGSRVVTWFNATDDGPARAYLPRLQRTHVVCGFHANTGNEQDGRPRPGL